ncbi:MAG TPA: Hsp20/alpha crystallin family protein [Vicinamibacterales bacterium]|jgi:HSP20 family protein|nr:Hsp20/alpha crystallin family protein [Vicinamibacterales bacterium]
MFERKYVSLAPATRIRDPFSMLRQMMSSLDRAFEELPSFGERAEMPAWSPRIDVFERDKRLVTRIDLPGLKKEDVAVEVMDGQLVISGERKHESEETNENVYRAEREYGSFYRAVPLPDGSKLEDVRATFLNGVLEVSVPLAPVPQAEVHKVKIEEPAPASMTAA